MTTYWQRGDTVVLRYALYERMTRTYEVLRSDPVNVAGWPYRVLSDSAARTVLYLPEGSALVRWDVAEHRYRPPAITQGHSVRLLYADAHYDVSAYYDSGTGPAPWVRYYFPGETGRFYGWKVDIVSPYRRTAFGFDVLDDVLDIIVRPDRTYRTKDDEQLTELVERDIYTAADADALRSRARDVCLLIDSGAPPFDDSWAHWQPPQDLGPQPLPEGWERMPLVSQE